MKKVSRMLVKSSKRLLALMLAIVTVVSVNTEGLIAFAEEVREVSRVYTGDSKYTNPFEYAIFSGGQESFLINADTVTVDGDILTNSDFVYRGNYISVNGSIETNDTCLINVFDADYKKKIGEISEYTNPVSFPSIADKIREEIQDEAVCYSGYGCFRTTAFNKKAIVNGDTYIYCNEFVGESVIVSSGSIEMGVDSLKSSNGSLFLCSENGNIQINASDTTMNGIIYAPNGTVMIIGDTFNLNGRIVAKKILFYGSKLNVIKGKNDLDMLECLQDKVPKLYVSESKGRANHVINVSLKDNIFLEDVDNDDIKFSIYDSNGCKLKEGEYFVAKSDDKYEYKLVFKNPGIYTINFDAKYHYKKNKW